jgi:hypothetical protein
MLYSPVEGQPAKPHTPKSVPPLATQQAADLKVMPPPEKGAPSPYKTLNLTMVSPNVEVDIYSARSSAQKAVRTFDALHTLPRLSAGVFVSGIVPGCATCIP